MESTLLADVHRLLVAVPMQQQLYVTVALHFGVNASTGVQVAASVSSILALP
jgi:hypothetical protein